MAGTEAEGLDYATLFEAGITFAQKLASDRWTDYNLHDPGVTILQQLCYALTDLAYRTHWEDADLFTPQQTYKPRTTFFPGPDILTCAPVTKRDHRNLLYAQIANVQNSWLRASTDPRKIDGLYDIDIQPYDPRISQEDPEALAGKVRSTYVTRRPLCEDVANIRILEPLPVKITAKIDIAETEAPEDIAAYIIASLQEHLIETPSYASIQTERDAGKSYDEIFQGPALNVLIYNKTSDERPMRLSVQRFEAVAASARGVRNIRNLSVEVGGQILAFGDFGWSDDQFPWIDAKNTFGGAPDSKSGITLWRGDREQNLNVERVLRNIEHQNYMDQEHTISTLRSIHEDLYNSAPIGVPRSLDVYTSIREQLPAIYGFGRYGVTNLFNNQQESKDYAERRSVQVDQLKAYLLIFDQVMANHLKQLASLPQLFSLDPAASNLTYYSQALEEPGAEGAGSIREFLLSRSETVAASLAEKQAHAIDRREKLLNHLLARFNENFDDTRWTRVWEAGCKTASDIDDMMKRRNTAKADFLSDYVFLGGFRGAGFAYSEPPAGQSSFTSRKSVAVLNQSQAPEDDSSGAYKRSHPETGLEQRLKALTGVTELYVVEHILLRNRADTEDIALADFYSLRLSLVAFENQPALQSFVRRAFLDNCPAHIDGRLLFLQDPQKEQFLGYHGDWQKAYARAFPSTGAVSRAALVDLDRQSLLLRTFLMDRAPQSDPQE